MLHSEFYALLDDVFTPAYARTVAREMVLTRLDSQTAEQAIAAGVPLRDVWHALCDEADVPERDRYGLDNKKNVPPRR